ncbi:MAG: hypothetical protein KJN61_00145 [Gammaproteobacteria bacterium]|nr:hypothetical protein [Gammaproteobacteria bacterium]
MKIKVLKTHPHGGKIRRQGEVYDCVDKKAMLMIVLGKAVEYIEPKPEPKPVRKKTVAKKVTASQAPKVETASAAGKYQTKVMTPED